eukprot:snap_masked-scaffold_59-processed-gene-0.65-mRNA-1 protein AED:1.00 eAED:1.00 QI:0/0/0/0/1/1/2/0/67
MIGMPRLREHERIPAASRNILRKQQERQDVRRIYAPEHDRQSTRQERKDPGDMQPSNHGISRWNHRK